MNDEPEDLVVAIGLATLLTAAVMAILSAVAWSRLF